MARNYDPRDPDSRKNAPRTTPNTVRTNRTKPVPPSSGANTLPTKQMVDMYRQRVPPAPVRPTTFGPDTRVMQARLIGLQAAANAPQDVGYTADDVAAAIAEYAGMGAGGGGGGGGGRGGGGVAGPSRKNVEDMIKAMTEAATASQGAIGNIYANADKTLAELAQQYATSQAALGAGAGRTLGAFGVTDQQMNPLGASASDYLTTTRGTLTGLGASQQAQLEAQKAAYALLMSDLLNR